MIILSRQVMSVPVQHVSRQMSVQSPFVSYVVSVTDDRTLEIRLCNILLV